MATGNLICQLLDLEFDPATIQFWRYDHHVISGNRGVNYRIQKYRGTESTMSKSLGRYKDYQDQSGFAIRLDLRWKEELSSEQLEKFYQIAGDLNKSREWE